MKMLLGVDEAGRGPIAGPVAVGVVAVEEGFDLLAVFPGLNDSKKLSEKKREKIFALLEEEVQKGNVRYSVHFSKAQVIDKKGIVFGVQYAMNRGLEKLLPIEEALKQKTHGDAARHSHKVLLDGALRAPAEYTQETIIGGDAIEPVIMLASVAAKVLRDRWMAQRIAVQFPHYGFEQHKGYGTAAHYEAIKRHGLCEEHRRSFLKNFSKTM
jgi:ribonuclease HII